MRKGSSVLSESFDTVRKYGREMFISYHALVGLVGKEGADELKALLRASDDGQEICLAVERILKTDARLRFSEEEREDIREAARILDVIGMPEHKARAERLRTMIGVESAMDFTREKKNGEANVGVEPPEIGRAHV